MWFQFYKQADLTGSISPQDMMKWEFGNHFSDQCAQGGMVWNEGRGKKEKPSRENNRSLQQRE